MSDYDDVCTALMEVAPELIPRIDRMPDGGAWISKGRATLEELRAFYRAGCLVARLHGERPECFDCFDCWLRHRVCTHHAGE